MNYSKHKIQGRPKCQSSYPVYQSLLLYVNVMTTTKMTLLMYFNLFPK